MHFRGPRGQLDNLWRNTREKSCNSRFSCSSALLSSSGNAPALWRACGRQTAQNSGAVDRERLRRDTTLPAGAVQAQPETRETKKKANRLTDGAGVPVVGKVKSRDSADGPRTNSGVAQKRGERVPINSGNEAMKKVSGPPRDLAAERGNEPPGKPQRLRQQRRFQKTAGRGQDASGEKSQPHVELQATGRDTSAGSWLSRAPRPFTKPTATLVRGPSVALFRTKTMTAPEAIKGYPAPVTSASLR